jgi:hypothetical protein
MQSVIHFVIAYPTFVITCFRLICEARTRKASGHEKEREGEKERGWGGKKKKESRGREEKEEDNGEKRKKKEEEREEGKRNSLPPLTPRPFHHKVTVMA